MELKYDMLKMALQYHLAVNNITVNKAFKLWKYELDDDDWEIISDLVCVLKVCSVFLEHAINSQHLS
jgi:hypothetical protein